MFRGIDIIWIAAASIFSGLRTGKNIGANLNCLWPFRILAKRDTRH